MLKTWCKKNQLMILDILNAMKFLEKLSVETKWTSIINFLI